MGAKPFIAGDKLTMADILLFAFLDFMAMSASRSIPANKNLTAWFERMKARPSAAAGVCPFSSFSGVASRRRKRGCLDKTQGPEMRRLIALLVSSWRRPVSPPIRRQLAREGPLARSPTIPSQTVRAGEIATIRVKLTMPACRPSRWRCRSPACRRAGRPTSWAAASRSPRPCPASTRASACSSASTCRRTPSPARRHDRAQRQGPAHPGARIWSFTLTVGTETPAKLSHEVAPAVADAARRARPSNIRSRSATTAARTSRWRCRRRAPANFQTTFTEGFGSNEISSIPIEAGQTKDIKVKVTPPRDVKAGNYPVLVKVASEGATAELG